MLLRMKYSWNVALLFLSKYIPYFCVKNRFLSRKCCSYMISSFNIMRPDFSVLLVVKLPLIKFGLILFTVWKFEHQKWRSPANMYLFKVNNRNTRTRCEICSKLTWHHQNDVKDLVVESLLLTLNLFHTFF